MRAIISTLLRLCFSHMSSTNASKLAVLFRNPPKLITFEVTLSPRHRREGLRWRLMGPAFYGNRVTRTGVHIKGFLIRLPYWKFSELRPKLKPVRVRVRPGWSFVCVSSVRLPFKGIEETTGNWMRSAVQNERERVGRREMRHFCPSRQQNGWYIKLFLGQPMEFSRQSILHEWSIILTVIRSIDAGLGNFPNLNDLYSLESPNFPHFHYQPQ